MSDIGPELPPYLLAKRKRKQEEAAAAAPAATSGAKQPDSPPNGEKRRKIVGPAMPPAPLEERPAEPAEPAEEDSSDEDDGFGPALPTNGGRAVPQRANDDGDEGPRSTSQPAPKEEKLKRDDWMMIPPKQDDLAARMDPSKQRARGFNTGKSARDLNAGGEDSSAWFETAEQKQKRLADEMMGVSQPAAGPQRSSGKPSSTDKDEAAARKIREHTEKIRGPSLMEQHSRTTGPEADDDPSKRAFDREKDMGSGMRINSTQRREMLNKANGFNSKFSGGSYL